jgi:cytochrome c oxidase subunit 4
MNDRDFHRHARHLLIAWVALIALMLASLGSAYVPLGIGNALTGVAIAIVKSAIVVTLFMGLGRAGALLRIVAAVALATWCILLVLGGLEQATRPEQPAVYQQPEQLQRQP